MLHIDLMIIEYNYNGFFSIQNIQNIKRTNNNYVCLITSLLFHFIRILVLSKWQHLKTSLIIKFNMQVTETYLSITSCVIFPVKMFYKVSLFTTGAPNY